MTFEYWFVFPVSIGVAMIAMASGVEGAAFFAPFFILGLGLPPEIAIGVGLITEVFGFASGLWAYVQKRLIDYRLGGALLMVTIPSALGGSFMSPHVNPDVLKVILGMGLLAVAFSFLRSPGSEEMERLDQKARSAGAGQRAETCLLSAQGEKICYTVCNRTEGRITAGIGGLFMGLISTGLGELSGYFLLRRCRVPSKVSVATSVFVVALTALSAATVHFAHFIEAGADVLKTVFNIVIFSVPGVIIGGQFGAMVASRLSQRILERALAILFIGIALLFLGQVILQGGFLKLK